MMQARLLVAFLVFCCAAGAANAQPLYRWTDEKGRVHVTDTPPPPNARSMEQRPASGARPAEQSPGVMPFELAQAMKDFPVVLYTSPECRDPCVRARAVLNKRAVPFKEIQVWDEASAAELKKVSSGDSVPVLLVGRSVQSGFEQGAYEALLDSARYPKAGLLPPRAQGAPAPPEGYLPPEKRAEPPRAEPVAPEAVAPGGPYSPGSASPRRLQKK